MPSEEKVQAIVKKLNGGKDDGEWLAATGLHMMPAVQTDEGGVQSIIPNTGVTVKLFFNTKTGETKVYIAGLLKDN